MPRRRSRSARDAGGAERRCHVRPQRRGVNFARKKPIATAFQRLQARLEYYGLEDIPIPYTMEDFDSPVQLRGTRTGVTDLGTTVKHRGLLGE
jgi:hypothetical protein